jgi:hypothetical protein
MGEKELNEQQVRKSKLLFELSRFNVPMSGHQRTKSDINDCRGGRFFKGFGQLP